jgi:excisionase family DNA binding protein
VNDRLNLHAGTVRCSFGDPVGHGYSPALVERIRASYRLERMRATLYDKPVLTTIQAAELANTTAHTVKREIHRGNLRAEKVGGNWIIDSAEAERWAAQFKPHAGLRGPRSPASG